MTLEELHNLAMKARQEAVAACDAAGMGQTAKDLMVPLAAIPLANVVQWAKMHQHSKHRPQLNTAAKLIVKAARQIQVYLYAQQHGVDAAMIWKLSQ